MNNLPNTVLVLYISIGYGHRNAAFAVKSALEELDPQTRTVVLDVFKLFNPGVVRGFTRFYQFLISNFPFIWEHVYNRREIKERLSGIIQRFYRLYHSRVEKLIGELEPGAVVCTQAFPCGLAAEVKKTTGRRFILAAVPTDYVVHDYWLDEKVDLYLVPSEESRRALLARGVKSRRVKVTGIPVHPGFAESTSRSALRQKYRFFHPEPAVLIMGGGRGLGPLSRLIRSLDRRGEDFQIAAVTGRNLNLHAKLTRLRKKMNHHLRVFSFVDSVDELMELADLIVTKPGGLTTAEAMAKNLPMVLVSPLPGQEVLNARFLRNQGAAVTVSDCGQAALAVSDLLNGSGTRERIKTSLKKIRRPSSALAAGRCLLEAING